MSLQSLSNKSLRRLQRQYPELMIVHAAAHHNHLIFCTNINLDCFYLNKQTGEIESSLHQGSWAYDIEERLRYYEHRI